MIKKILAQAWRYWKWICVALLTTYALLILATGIINFFKSPAPSKLSPAEHCIESGGRWNADTQSCEVVG